MGKNIIITLLSVLPILGLEMSPLSGSWITSIIIWGIWLILVIAFWKGWPKKIWVSFKDSFTATEMDDKEKGEHLRDIKGKLILWKKQLRTLSKKKNIVGDLITDIEKDPDFYQVLQHCPSLTEPAKNLGLARMNLKAKLKSIRSGNYQESKKGLKEQREGANLKMKAVAKAIDIGLSKTKNEYSQEKNLCDWCKKHRR